MKKFIAILILSAVIFLQGCLAFLASQLGLHEAKTKYSRLYDMYKMETEEINIERQRNGLPPQSAKEFKDWIKEQPLTHNEIKVFREYGVISNEDAQEIKKREN